MGSFFNEAYYVQENSFIDYPNNTKHVNRSRNFLINIFLCFKNIFYV